MELWRVVFTSGSYTELQGTLVELAAQYPESTIRSITKLS